MLFVDSLVQLETSRTFFHSYPTGGSVCKVFDEAFLNGDCAGVVFTAYLLYEAIAELEPHVEQTLHWCTQRNTLLILLILLGLRS